MFLFHIYLETKKLSAKSLFKCQNKIQQSKHVFPLLIAKKITSRKSFLNHNFPDHE